MSPKGIIDKKSFNDKMKMLAPPSIFDVLSPAIEECAEKGNH